ncbi:hypothetical protein [Salinigranum salinum]|uniref:hypothetical protein n=1 Tax=Salinigranum salinum TaxID=1364937 RepID=UPI0012604739|nr:hypothetical protein [Salinigranum salinum]
MGVTAVYRDGAWAPLSGVAAVVGSVLWMAMPWLQLAALGTRPYVGTAFDVGSFLGWLLMAVGLVGARTAFGDRYGRVGRAGVALSGAGMTVVAGLLLRRVAVFVDAGFRRVPATGEDPAGLVLTWAFLLGFGLVFVGGGLLGVALWRLGLGRPLAAGVLVAAPMLVLLLLVLRLLSLLPLPFGRALVGTNIAFVPLAVGWMALGRLVYTVARADG